VFGASLARHCLAEGLVDEIVIHLAPVLLVDGVRLFDSPGFAPVILEGISLAASGRRTDLRFRVAKQPAARAASRKWLDGEGR